MGDKEINQKRDAIVKLKAQRSEAIQEERKARDEKQGNLKGLFSQTKELNHEITDLNDEKKLFEADIDKLQRAKDVIVKQMYGKKMMSLRACESMIEELDHRQKTERLTAIEERAILKDLKELRDTKPLIQQTDEKDTEIQEIKKKKQVLGKKIHDKIEARNAIN